MMDEKEMSEFQPWHQSLSNIVSVLGFYSWLGWVVYLAFTVKR